MFKEKNVFFAFLFVYLQNEDDRKFENHETPIESDTSEGAVEIDRTQFTDKLQTYRENSVKQCEDLDLSDQLPESMIFLYTGLAQSNVNKMHSFDKTESNIRLFFLSIR